MSVTRRFVIAALAAIIVLIQQAPSRAADTAAAVPASNPAAVLRLSGEVNDYTRDMLFRRFREAEAAGAKTILLEIDTYGGMVSSAMDISRFLRGQTSVHVVAIVANKAISAGSMIAMACDEIVMAQGSVIGDCAPIFFDRQGRLRPLPETERAKKESPILEDFAASTKRNGYNPLITEAMVRVQTSIYLVQDAQGRERLVNEADYQKLTATGDWKPSPGVSAPVDGPETLLTIGPDMAQRLGLSKGFASSAKDLAEQRHYTIIADLTPGVGDGLVQVINGDIARFILIVVFLLSLYIALHAPGQGAPEAIAIISLGLLVGVPLLTGFAQWWEIGLIFLGLALCAFEIMVFPGHGVSLIVGVLMVLFGLLMTFAGKELNPGWLPTSYATWHHLERGLMVIVGAMTATIVGAFILQPYLPKLPMFRKLILSETSGGPLPSAGGPPLKAGEDVWPFVGTIGIAISELKPGGNASFPYGDDTRAVSVISASGFVEPGTKVTVQEARGNRIVVKVA